MAFTGTDRFELLGRLGEGGMGVVYEAYDRARGMSVALKTLRRVNATHLLRFKREFRALRELGHPNIITLYELIAEGKQWLFTMELIHGQDMVSYIRRRAPSEGPRLATSVPGAAPEAMPEAAPDAMPEAAPDAMPDATVEDSVTALDLARAPGPATEDLLDGDTSVEEPWGGAATQPGLTTFPELDGDTAVTQTLSDSAIAWPAGGSGAAAGTSGQRRHLAERVDLEALRDVCAQLAGALRALHGAGMIHRDIKPSNVMVTREGRVVLMDFGIVAETRQPRALTVVGAIQGTPAFMAPEQVRGEPLTGAADWYAFGVILYTLLAGRLPHDGGRAQVLFGKQVLDALPPSRFTAGIPDELEHLCMRLLAREPGERPGSREVLAALGVKLGARSPTALEAGRELFVGRARELAELERLYREACDGTMRCALVEAASGMGKSRLAERFLADLPGRAGPADMTGRVSESVAGAVAGAVAGVVSRIRPVILTGRCHERESLPYKAFDGVMDLLSQYLAELPEEVRRACLPSAIYLLARLFPVLRRVPECDLTVTFGGDPRPLRLQALRALRGLLAELGRIRPIVVHIDDVQWIDRDSVELLTGLMQAPVPGRLLLLLCARQEAGQGGEHGALDDLCAAMAGHEICQRIELGPLLPDEQQSLVDALGARLGRRRMDDAVWRDSAGHPLLMAELARYVQDDGDTSVEAPGLHDILWRRVARLSEAERALLAAVACLGEPAPLRVLADAAALSYADRERALTMLVTGQMVRITRTGHEPWVDIYHAVLREAVIARLGSEAARALHRQIARSLEGWSDASPALRARHWQAAGEHDRAARCLLAAARSAAAQLAFDRADELYRQALALLDEILDDGQGEERGAGAAGAGEAGPGAAGAGAAEAGAAGAGVAGEDGQPRAHPERALRRIQAQAWIGLAEGLRMADRDREALALLDRAHVVASAHDFVAELADIHYLRGNLLFPRGDLDGCLAEYTRARALAHRAGLPLREARAASGLGHAHYMSGQMISAQLHYDHCLALSRAHGFDDVLASNLSMRGLTRFYQNDLQAALQNGEEAAALATRVGHRRAELNALCHCTGLIWSELGHVERAHQAFARAIELSRELGSLRFEASAWLFLGKLLAMQGRYDEALPLIERSLAHSRQIGIGYVGPIALGALALVTTDAAAREQALAEAEHVLRTRVSSHNHLYFYRDAMEVSLAIGDHERLARYALALEQYTAAEPLPWSDFFIARARLLAAHARGHRDPEMLLRIDALYRRGREAGYHFATEALEQALSAGPGTLRGY
jgi:predicted ATPase